MSDIFEKHDSFSSFTLHPNGFDIKKHLPDHKCPAEQRQDRWDRRFMEDAHHVARNSKDRSTQVGCVIVNDRNTDLARGWNGFPRGIDDDVEARHKRPAKYLWTEHAERNAIYNAAAEGIALKGTTIYSTLFPCCDCARAIIQSGIKRICSYDPLFADARVRSTFSHSESYLMLEEAGIEITIMPPQTSTEIRNSITNSI